MGKKEKLKVDRSKHFMTSEDHKKTFKGICEKFNIDHEKAIKAATMHYEGHTCIEKDGK